MANPIRNFVLRVRQGLNNMFSGGRTEHVQSRIPPEKVEDVNEMIDRDRGYTLGKAAQEKRRRVRAEEAAKQEEEVDVTEEMREERKRLAERPFEGEFSLWKLFKHTRVKNNRVDVLSADYKNNLGRFKDIRITKDGLLDVVTEKEGREKHAITGRTVQDIIRNYGSLNDTVKNGNFIVNVDEEGNYSENVLDKDVPKVVVDENGDIITTKALQEPFIRQLAQKEQRINQLLGDVKSSEEAWMGEHQNLRKLQEQVDVERTGREAMETELSDTLESTETVMKNWGEKQNENFKLQLGKKMAEDMTEVQEEARQKLLGKYQEWFDKKEVDLAKDEVQELVDWTMAEMTHPVSSENIPENEG